MADITSTLSEFDEWLKKRRQSQVAGMGTIESGDYGAKPYYTETGGLGEVGPAMNPQQYSRLGNIMNPPTPETPALPEYTGVPGPGTAAREEGIESIRLAAQGVPKVSALETATNQLAPEEFSRPDVWSGQRFVPGAAANEQEYNKNWQIASALESAGKPYWETERTKAGTRTTPHFQPQQVLQGKLESYSGGLQVGVKKDLAEVDRLIGAGKHEEAAALAQGALAKFTGVQAAEFPASEKAERAERYAHAGYLGAAGESLGTTNKMTKQMYSALDKLDMEEEKAKSAFMSKKGIPPGQTGLIWSSDNATQKAWSALEQDYATKRKAITERYSAGLGTPATTPTDPAMETLKTRARAGDIKAQRYLTTKGVTWQ